MDGLRSLVIAFAMYSKIPVPNVEWNEKNMRYAMCFFPVVGIVIGAAVYGCGRLFPNGTFLFAAVMTLLPILITGGIHLDGYADTVDAISSYGDREKKLEILKDPHAGAFAVIGLAVYFIADLALWTEFPSKFLLLSSCTFVLSRCLSGLSVVSFKAAKDSGLLRTFQDHAQKRTVKIVLSIWTIFISTLMLFLQPVAGAAVVLSAFLVFLYYYFFSKRQFGGTTGDLAGFFLQNCELAMLLAMVIVGVIL